MTDDKEREAVASDYQVTLVEDRPAKGQWHCGPNPAWVLRPSYRKENFDG